MMLRRASAMVGRVVRAPPFSTAATKRFSAAAAPEVLPPPASLSKDQALSSSRIVLDFVRFGVSGRRLDALAAASGTPVQDRWTHAMQVLVAAQAHAASAFGYEPSAEGVMLYRTHLAGAAQAAGPEALAKLRTLDKEVWSEVLLRGFALAPRPMAPEAAREFAGKVAAAAAASTGALGDALTADLAALPTNCDAAARAQHALGAVQKAMGAVQTELAPDVGYGGDDGYVQLQVALVEHMADPAVAHATQSATHALCARAGITPPS
jgi:hypothetical protein